MFYITLWRLRFSSDADIVCLTNARIVIIIIIIPTKMEIKETRSFDSHSYAECRK